MLRALALALLLCGCGEDEVFEAPDQPDLYKTPYDFGVPGKGDGGVKDASVPDLLEPPDLREVHDLTSTEDLTTID